MKKLLHRFRTIPPTIWAAYALILLGIALRVLRHFGVIALPPNVAPVSAMAMFSGAYLGRRAGWVVPILLMLGSDILIGFDLLPITISIYTCFIISGVMGRWWQRRQGALRLAGVTLIGSVTFFLVTNATVWAFAEIYPHTMAGLMDSYIAGLPFFRNTLLGDLGYTATFFGLYRLFVVYLPRMILRPVRPNHE